MEHKSSSSHSPEESPGTPPASASPVIDADLARMEALLDNWCLDLKRNVLVSYSTSHVSYHLYADSLLIKPLTILISVLVHDTI